MEPAPAFASGSLHYKCRVLLHRTKLAWSLYADLRRAPDFTKVVCRCLHFRGIVKNGGAKGSRTPAFR